MEKYQRPCETLSGTYNKNTLKNPPPLHNKNLMSIQNEKNVKTFVKI